MKPSSSKIQTNQLQIDQLKRNFLKLLGSAGLVAILMSIFKQDTEALQFGGTMNLPKSIEIEPLGNSQTTGSVVLTTANTWYQVPSSNLADRVFLVVQNRTDTDMYWSFSNSISAVDGGLILPNGGTLQLDAGFTVSVYVRCTADNQTVWYSESQSQ